MATTEVPIQTTVKIKEIIRISEVQLNADKWASVLYLHLKSRRLQCVSSLSIETDFEELKECANDDLETECLRTFLAKVGLESMIKKQKEELRAQLKVFNRQYQGLLPTALKIREGLIELHKASSNNETTFSDFIQSMPELVDILSPDQFHVILGGSWSQKDPVSSLESQCQTDFPVNRALDDSAGQLQVTTMELSTPSSDSRSRTPEDELQLTKVPLDPPTTSTSPISSQIQSNRLKNKKGKKSTKPKKAEPMNAPNKQTNVAQKQDSYHLRTDPQTKKTNQKSAQKNDIFKLLHLDSSTDEKIAFHEIVRIQVLQPNGGARAESNIKFKKQDLAWILLRRLITFDSAARDLVPKSFNQESAMPQSIFEESADSTDALNPMDVLLASYLSCDKEVQQILCRTLFLCKLSFPLIYIYKKNAIIVSNWSLRDIPIEFRDHKDQYIETSLVSDHPFRVVSFIRMGEITFSKSRLLNALLNGNDHATFFHRDCSNGHAKRVLSNGVVEGSVFMPTKGIRMLEGPFLAANLRGDALQLPKRLLTTLSDISDVLVIFLDSSTISNADCFQFLFDLERQVKLVLIICKRTDISLSVDQFTLQQKSWLERTTQIVTRRGDRTKNEKELLLEMEGVLSKKMKEIPGSSLNSPKLRNAQIDEDQKLAKNKLLSQKVMGHFTNDKIESFKEKHMPLQAIWIEYSQLYKTENSAKTASPEQIETQKQRIERRNSQVKCCAKLSPFMSQFLKSLEETVTSKDDLSTKLFLQYTKLTFDDASRKMLPEMISRCRQLREEIQQQSLKEGCEQSKQLSNLEKSIMNSSVGMENVFREVGQIFEAVNENSIPQLVSASLAKLVKPLPDYFAKLLLLGVPVEVMDGDAGNIPILWVSAILKSCRKLVGDKKIFVISVLGLQSSGKSTLLNTMFGLKFAVSAGRCTRGAFMQLVPVEPGMPFDYIAVIDTEGLRAPELGLDKHRHDNELATLVIGLGDVTIINIKGENTAEMKDILQIAIHAFIRMKLANKMKDLHRRCIFIHQNVPAVGAKEKMQEAAIKMQETLDTITKEAAEGEGLESVKRFGDVLEFKKDSDIFYMSDLWLGDPPMAPVNPGYSQKVQEIKHHLIYALNDDQKHFASFTDFSTRVNDIWKATVSEDFVFSFRNSIELKAYNMVEREYCESVNEIEQMAFDWLYKEASIKLKKCLVVPELTVVRDRLLDECSTLIHCEKDKGSTRLEEYFATNNYREYTVQWKERKLIAFQSSAEDVVRDVKRKIEVLFHRQKSKIEQEPMRTEWERALLVRAKSLAKRVKDSNPNFLKMEFEKLWDELMKELPAESADETHSIDTQVHYFLQQTYQREHAILRFFLKNWSLEPEFIGSLEMTDDDLFSDLENTPKLVELHSESFWKHFKGQQLFPDKKQRANILFVVNTIISSVKPIVKYMRKLTIGFSRQFLVAIQKHLRIELNGRSGDVSNLINSGIFPTTALEIRLVLHALRYAYPVFLKIDKRFKLGSSLKGRLTETKEQMWNMFKNLVHEQDSAKVVADFCRDHLSTVIKDAIKERMKIRFKARILNEIGRTKYQLIVAMLTDMATRDDFNAITLYAVNPHYSATNWVTDFTNKMLFFSSDKQETLFSEVVRTEFIEPLFSAVKNAAKAAAVDCNSLQMWISMFCTQVESELAVVPQNLQMMCNLKPAKVEDVKNALIYGLDDLSKKLVDEYSEIDCKSVQWHGESTLYSDILDAAWGCKKRCPFCNEPCQKSRPNHYEEDGSPHCCIQHKPQAVNGTFWHKTDNFTYQTCQYDVISTTAFCCQFQCKRHGISTDTCSKNSTDPYVWHPFKEYKKYFPEWDIVPDAANTSAKFWMWFCWKFQKEMESRWKKGLEELPPAWAVVTKEEAIDSLRSLLE